ncbi:MAG: co-chaperone GroES [Candidatus Riflebacteria bacterium]|nr:co-chaperone GroES [Candidatus Riflebacteria bacterium]
MDINVTPTRNRVLLEIMEAEQKTKGGIILPDTASKEKPHEGRVIAVGTGRVDRNGKTIPMQVKKGDKVLFSEWSGNEIEIEGKKLLIIKDEDLLAIQ